MSRSKLTQRSLEVDVDTGSVLFSLIQGEQLESTITLGFIPNVGGYEFEAVVMEALNIEGEDTIPNKVRPGGVNSQLNIRIPPYVGAWSGVTGYNAEDVVVYLGVYYKLSAGALRVNSTAPNSDGVWEVYVPNKIYVQWPTTLGASWSVQPTPDVAVQGFFELSVREPTGTPFRRLWKPVRGMVEISYSPTYLV